MNARRMLAVSKRVFIDLRNDRRSLALIIIAPLFSMMVFGLAFSGDVKNVDILVVNMDTGVSLPAMGNVSLASRVIDNMDHEVLNIGTVDSLGAARESLERGDVWAVVYFPENYTLETMAALNGTGPGAAFTLYIDRSNVNIAGTIATEVNSALMSTMEQNGGRLPVSIDTVDIYGKGAKFMDFFVPGIVSFAVYLLTTLLTLMTFIGERVNGTLSRVLATPLTESEIVGGYALTFSIVGAFQSVFLILVGILVFNVMIVGNVFLVFLIVALLAVVCQALGILLSAFAQREAQAAQFLPFIVMPAFLLSGVFWPLEAIPSWLRPASYFVPPSYSIEAARSVMLRGWGLDMIWPQMLALVVFAAVLLILAAISLKRRE